MPATHDVTIGGIGYTLVPKTYRRGLDNPGSLGGPPQRQVQSRWRGALRPVALEIDRHRESRALWPIRGAGGTLVTVGPRESNFLAGGFSPALTRIYGVIDAGRPYVARGGKLWRPIRTDAGPYPNNLLGLEQLGTTLAQTINGLVSDGDGRIYASRNGAGYAMWLVGGSAWDLTATVAFTGIAYYVGSLWGGHRATTGWQIARASAPNALDAAGTFPISGPPRAWLTARDALYVTDDMGLHRVQGRVVSGAFVGGCDMVAGFGEAGLANDGTSLTEYEGQVYSFVGGEVVRYHSGGSAPSQWVGSGLIGWKCQGLASVGGYLWASIVATPASSGCDLWCYDGTGWWRMASNAPTGSDYSYVMGTAAYFDNAHLLAFQDSTNRVYAFQLRSTATQFALNASGELTSSLYYGRDADDEKLWDRVGAEFGHDASTFATHDLALDWSTNGGATWATGPTAAPSDGQPRTLSAAINARAKTLLLRVRYANVTDGATPLRALWAEHRPIEQAAHRDTWEMVIAAEDQQQRRSGVDPRTGGGIAADLWAAFRAGGTVAFRDIDYDRVAVERQVRIATLTEEVGRPADAGRVGESRLRVRLVEV